MKCYKCDFLGLVRYYITNYFNDEYVWCNRNNHHWRIGGSTWTKRKNDVILIFQEVSPLEILVVMGVDVEAVVRGGLESP